MNRSHENFTFRLADTINADYDFSSSEINMANKLLKDGPEVGVGPILDSFVSINFLTYKISH